VKSCDVVQCSLLLHVGFKTASKMCQTLITVQAPRMQTGESIKTQANTEVDVEHLESTVSPVEGLLKSAGLDDVDSWQWQIVVKG
jgi:hypothetical protein